MGNIGQAIAKRCRLGFDMDVLYYNRSRRQEIEEIYQAKYCSLHELLQNADFIVLMVPRHPETDKMIGKEEFKLMKIQRFLLTAHVVKMLMKKRCMKRLFIKKF